MKNFFKITCLITVFLFLCVVASTAQTTDERIWLSTSTDKNEYLLGEVVNLNFIIGNAAEETVTIERAAVERGNLRLYVSEDGKTFRQYVGPDWGTGETRSQRIELKPGAQYETTATMLFNHRLAREHLNDLYAEGIHRSRLDSHYALPRAGRYFLKAVLAFGEKSTIESKPVEVLMVEPVGENGLAWEILRNNFELGYFLHAGEFRGDEESEKQLRAALMEIVERYPNCIYAPRIKENLERLSR